MFNKVGSMTVVILLVMSIILLSLPATASSVSGENSKQSDYVGYTVMPDKHGSGFAMPMVVYGTITQDQTCFTSKDVTSYTNTVYVDLNWGNPSNSLQLTIYAPDGSKFGPYYDNFDGVTDGRIQFSIYNANGVAQGTWYYHVYGYSVTGVQSYYI